MSGAAVPVAEPRASRPERQRRAWALVGAAAAAWIGAYALNRPLWDWLLYDRGGLDSGTRLGDGVHFFLYDTVKIALLLSGIIFAVAVVRTFVTIERTRELLGSKGRLLGFALAAALGVATPFCSCSAVPVFIGFVAAGVPLGMTMTFLIASPLVNEVAVVLVAGSFGWDVAVLYIATGVVIAVVGGIVIDRLGLDRWVEPFVYDTAIGTSPARQQGPSWQERFRLAQAEVGSILGKVWPYVLVGIGLGAIIHGWVPADFFARYAGPDNPLAVPLAVIMGIPLYSNAAGTIPLVEALNAKGVALGTSLAFMMSVVALSLPEMVLLRRVLRPRLLAVFVGVVGAGIVAVGYLFNAVL